MEKYILEKDGALSKDICDEIIYLFKTEIKDNRITIPFNYVAYSEDSIKYKRIADEINKCITDQIDSYFYKINNNTTTSNKLIHRYLNSDSIFKKDFHIKQYIKDYNPDRRFWYDNFLVSKNIENKLTFIFYLNDNFEGGETEFINGNKIVPKKGKFILFPTSWTFSYKENDLKNKNEEKFIVKGYLFENKIYVK